MNIGKVGNRRILVIETFKDSASLFFNIGMHSCFDTLLSINIGLFGGIVWISFFDLNENEIK